ncbi:hypothetical protein ACFY30_37260 [Streptomyces sp. NPDC000345]|uniref:hypothetical protein n=1 Tax=Streptomyces sp. NPDC000345 TaxID=3364537 RepID=UPI0036CD1B3B
MTVWPEATSTEVVAAVKDVLRRQRGRSKGTVSALMPRVAQVLQDRYGTSVPMPAQATFYRLVRQLAGPADHPAHPARTPPITEDGRGHTPTVALRPGEQVQIDTTRLDALALFDDGTLGRPEMTIAVDVATRAILAAVLCPGGTQAVDAALLLAEMAVPHPARPTWPDALRFTHTQLPAHKRLLTLDERLEQAAARPVVILRHSSSTGAKSSCPGRSPPPVRASASVCSPPRPTPPPPKASSSAPSARSMRCSASACPATQAPTSPAAAKMPNTKRASPSRNCRTCSTNGSSTTTTAPTKGCAIPSCPGQR